MATFEPVAIADYGNYLGAEAYSTVRTVGQFAISEGMSDVGFGDPPSLLAPLGDIVSGPAADLVREGFTIMETKLCQLGDSVIAAAKTYGEVETINHSLAERITTPAPTDTKTLRGMFDTPSVAEDHSPHGPSKFKVSEPVLTPPDRPEAEFSDQLSDSLAGDVLSVLDWIWTEFNVDGGQSFTATIVEPLSGNPGSIRANGDAWKTAASGMADLAGTMGANLTELRANDWDSPAAEALENFLVGYWKDGAAWVAAQVGEFIAIGFNKVADVCTQLAGEAIGFIEKIIKLAIKVAAKAAPIIGWAWTAIEAAGSFIGKFFGIDIDNIADDIDEIIQIVPKVTAVYDAIRDVVSAMKAYVDQVRTIVDFAQQIPNLQSVTPGEVTTAVRGLSDKQSDVKTSLDAGGAALADVDEAMNG